MKLERELFRTLEKIVGKGYISDTEVARVCHAYDGTKQRAMPDVVIRPFSAEEISKILQIANERYIPVYPIGAASGMTGGAVPLHGGISLNMNRMNRIIEIDEVNMISTVEPGVIVGDLQREVEKVGLFYPPDPASHRFSTMGGSVAECSGGLRGIKYGVTKDYVIALELVLPTGEIIHTGSKTLKSVTGYDLTKLFIGSEGTLGIFTKIVVKLIPLPEKIETILASFNNIIRATDTVSSIIASKILPRALEFIDEESIKAVRNYKRSSVMKETKAMLLIEVDGGAETVQRDARRIMSICKNNKAIEARKATTEKEVEELWSVRRSISPALSTLSKEKISQDICVPRSKLTRMLHTISEIATKHGIKIVNFGHAGDGNIHINILINPDLPEQLQHAENAVGDIFKETINLGGTLSGEHGIGNTKSKYLPLEVKPRELKLMKDIKALLDPNGILNPGKIFSIPT
jgi:glycolate oxidase